MLILIPFLILFIVPLIMLAIQLRRPLFAYQWLIAASAVLLVWILILLAYLQIPSEISLITWKPKTIFPVSPTILLDNISWSYSMALITLSLAMILTGIIRGSNSVNHETNSFRIDWISWAISLIFVSLGILAAMAGNLITLLLAWAALDIIELIFRIGISAQHQEMDRIVAAFTTRMLSVILVIWAITISLSENNSTSLTDLIPRSIGLLLLAATIRIGVYLFYPIITRPPLLQRSLGTLIHLVSAAASLILITRLASIGLPDNSSILFTVIAAIIALIGGIMWSTSQEEHSGQPYWILAVFTLSLASAINSELEASLAWGIVLLLPGGLLFLYAARDRRLLLLPVLGLVGISTLPYTPAWQGVSLYPALDSILLLIIFIVSQALLLFGYLRFMLRSGEPLSGYERIVWIIYPWGLALFPIIQFLIAILSLSERSAIGSAPPSLLESWPAFAACGLAGLLTLIWLRAPKYSTQFSSPLKNFFSISWLLRIFRDLFHTIERTVAFIDNLIEGRGAILWTILLITFLITLLVQLGTGG